MDLHAAFAVIALIAFAGGGIVGFLIGIDAAAQIFARRWLELHPDDGPLPLTPRWWR